MGRCDITKARRKKEEFRMLQEIFDRRSVRHYTEEPVTRDQLTEMLRAAMNAPSAKNCQEWRFVVITDRATLGRISEIHPFAKMMLQAQAAILVSCDMDLAFTDGHGYLDCGAAIENLLLEAVHQGLSTCWCGIAPMVDRISNFRMEFELPGNLVPMGIVAVGHAKQSRDRKDQYDPEKVVWWKN